MSFSRLGSLPRMQVRKYENSPQMDNGRAYFNANYSKLESAVVVASTARSYTANGLNHDLGV